MEETTQDTLTSYKKELIRFIENSVIPLMQNSLNTNDKDTLYNVFPKIMELFSEEYIYKDKVKLVCETGIKYGCIESDNMSDILSYWKDFLKNRETYFFIGFEVVLKEDESIPVLAVLLDFKFINNKSELIMNQEYFIMKRNTYH